MYAADHTLYEVEHTWRFSATTYSSDIGQAIADAYMNDAISQGIAFDSGWVEIEGERANPIMRMDDKPWWGAGADTVLLEVWNSYSYPMMIHMVRDGERAFTITNREYPIVCVRGVL